MKAVERLAKKLLVVFTIFFILFFAFAQGANAQQRNFFQRAKDTLVNLLPKGNKLPAIEKAWIDESNEIISKRDLNIVLKFKRRFPASPPKDDEFAGILIDLDRNPKTGILLPKGKYSDQPPYQYNDLGIDLFVGLKSKNKEWRLVSGAEKFVINGDNVIITIPLQNLATEFLWKAAAGSSEVHTGTKDRNFIIRELASLNRSE